MEKKIVIEKLCELIKYKDDEFNLVTLKLERLLKEEKEMFSNYYTQNIEYRNYIENLEKVVHDLSERIDELIRKYKLYEKDKEELGVIPERLLAKASGIPEDKIDDYLEEHVYCYDEINDELID